MSGRTISIYLVDGTPSGLRIADDETWPGQALACKRADLNSLARRSEASRPGVYFLVGPDVTGINRPRVYIGESDNVFKRLVRHDDDPRKEFWDEAVLFTSKKDSFTKSHVRYLEGEIIALAKQTGLASIENSVEADERPLSERDRVDMQVFLEHIELMLPILGYNFLQRIPLSPIRHHTVMQGTIPELATEAPAAHSDVPVFEFKRLKKFHATATEEQGDFIVLAGSSASSRLVPEMGKQNALTKEKLIVERTLIPSEDGATYVFCQNVRFGSPSAAASVVCGASTNGRINWKVAGTSLTYDEWHKSKFRE